MSIEIELKAHVENCQALKLLLSKKAEYKRAFEKDDTYWFTGEETHLTSRGLSNSAANSDKFNQINKQNSPPTKIRLRREKRSFPDGTNESLVFVTYKTKQVKDGIETNDEREFEIRSSASRSETDFENLLSLIGFKPGITKRKKGWLFLKEGINAELTSVECLGWFIELEILAEDNREETVSAGREKLLAFLDELCIERTAIESRFYTEMLGNNVIN